MPKPFCEEFLKSGAIVTSQDGRLLVGYGKRTWHPNPVGDECFYFPDFFLEDQMPWFTHEKTATTTVDALLKELGEITTCSLEWKNLHQPLFEETFQGLQEKFLSGELKKAVPFVYESSVTKMNASLLKGRLHSLLHYANNRPVFVYGFWDEERGILGATPEILFTVKERGQLQTVACAGTCRSGSDQGSLINDPKEVHEHQLVVEGITESLKPFGKVKPGKMELLELPTLCHLVTPIQATFDDVSMDQVVRALHPTPALGAFPREAGMRWLRDYQTKINRRHFGAPSGYVQGDQAAFYVSIRNIQWDNVAINIGAGCGVVPASQCEQEWAEINLKIAAIKEMLAL